MPRNPNSTWCRSRQRTEPENAEHAAALARTRAERDTKDETCRSQKELSERIDLGLSLLEAARLPNQTFTAYDIAAWAGCTNSLIRIVEKRALLKLANALRFGRHKAMFAELFGAVSDERPLSAEEIRAEVAKLKRPLSRDEVRRALARLNSEAPKTEAA